LKKRKEKKRKEKAFLWFLVDGIEKHVIEQVPLFFLWNWRIQ
jgi:hypothetical protein